MGCGRKRSARRARSSGSPRSLGVAAPHAALDRPQAEDRLAGGGAACALSAAGGAAREGRRPPCADRAHARRPGRDRAVPAARGSGVSGLAAHGAAALLPGRGATAICAGPAAARRSEGAADRDARKAGIAFADDPSNRDPRFTRARLRELMPVLAARGARPPSGWRCWRGGCGGPRRRWRRRWTQPSPSSRRCRGRTAGRSRSTPREFARLAGGDRAAAARPRHRPGRQRGPGRTRQARGAARRRLAGCRSDAARFRRTLAGAMVTLHGRPADGRARARAPQPRRLESALTKRKADRCSFGTRRRIGLECAGFAALLAGRFPWQEASADLHW